MRNRSRNRACMEPRLPCSTPFPKHRGETSALQEISVDGTNSVNDKSAVYCGWPQSRDARSLSHADSCALCICRGCCAPPLQGPATLYGAAHPAGFLCRGAFPLQMRLGTCKRQLLLSFPLEAKKRCLLLPSVQHEFLAWTAATQNQH